MKRESHNGRDLSVRSSRADISCTPSSMSYVRTKLLPESLSEDACEPLLRSTKGV